MHRKNDSMGPPASSSSVLGSAYLQHTGEGIVAVDEGQKIVALRGGVKR